MDTDFTKKSTIVITYINQRTVQLVDKEIDVAYLQRKMLTTMGSEFKNVTEALQKAKEDVKNLEEVLIALGKKRVDYLKEEAGEPEKVAK